MRHALHVQAPFAIVLVLACALGSTASVAAPAADETGRELSPAAAAAVLERMQAMPTSVTEGRRLFLALNCYGCHGANAAGAIGPPIAGASRAAVEFNVLNGNAGGMPSFDRYVNEADITRLTDYLDSIGTAHEPLFVDWWKRNPKK